MNGFPPRTDTVHALLPLPQRRCPGTSGAATDLFHLSKLVHKRIVAIRWEDIFEFKRLEGPFALDRWTLNIPAVASRPPKPFREKNIKLFLYYFFYLRLLGRIRIISYIPYFSL
jgi:hypothetical protein